MSGIIDLGYDENYNLTETQLEYFYKHAIKPVFMNEDKISELKETTGFNQSWINNVLNLSLIDTKNTFSFVEKPTYENHLDYFPQFKNLQYFETIISMDLSLIDSEVYYHQDGVMGENGHGYGFKIIPHGDARDFYMMKHDKATNLGVPGTEYPIGSNSNIFLIDNEFHGHYLPKNPHPFIVLFVIGIYTKEFNDYILQQMQQ